MRTEPQLLLKGSFSPKLRIYMMVAWTAALVMTIVGIALLPVWLIAAPIYIRRYHATLRCDVTERNVIIGKGLWFRRELTIPLDKIQDISIREGPLLSAFGLLQLRIETAGQSSSATGKSDADLIGLIDPRALRDRILAQRDALAAGETLPVPRPDDQTELLMQIRDSLLRIEAAVAARPDGADRPPPFI